MNASYEWLKSLVPFDLTPAELRDLLTARCATVDEIVPLRADLADVVIGLVVEAGRHPDSDHLWVTKVDAGTGELLDVVCGAQNVQAGRKYPFAPSGSTLPGGLKLERRKIRGAVSNGMLCSARELLLGDDHAGILELTTDAPPGTPFLSAVAVGDTRLVVDVTPNRPDLLSHVGLAREIAAATGVALQRTIVDAGVPMPQSAPERASAGGVAVELQDANRCPRYMGVVLRGVRIAPSPVWLTERLLAIGVRPISNVVDVTNYMLHDLGQPMHAFDAAKLAGPAVIIRRARSGERLTTLDGVDRALDPDMTVIADGERAQAIAGVLGGRDAEVADATTDIFLEVAAFDPASVRRTRRALGLSTDASYRFERGTDIAAAPDALRRAVAMLLGVAGGVVDGAPVDLYPRPSAPTQIALRVSRVARVLGVPIPAAEIRSLLEPVGFVVTDVANDSVSVRVPPWRRDVDREVHLLEEVARLRGFDSFPDELRPFRPGRVPDSPVEVLSRTVRERLIAAGLLETRPMPFVRGASEGFVRVANPLSEDEAYLRRDVLDTLARRAEYNLARMQRDVRLFEIGAVFSPSGDTLPREEVHVGALVMGGRRPPHWTEQDTPDFDEWDAKGIAEQTIEALGHDGRSSLRAPERPAIDDGRKTLWEIVIDGERRGSVCRIALDAPVWAAAAFGVELRLADVDSMVVTPGSSRSRREVEPRVGGPSVTYRPLLGTPAAEFDLALLLPAGVTAERVEDVVRSAVGDLLETLVLFDEYRGNGVPEGYRSVAWRITLRHPERTLKEKEIAARRDKLLRALEGELGVRQRTA